MKNYLIFSILFLSFFACNKSTDIAPKDELSIVSEGLTGDKVLIRLKPKVGTHQKMMMQMALTSDGNQEMEMNLNMKMDLKVVDKEAEVFMYDLTYNSIQMDMNTMGMSFSFDSEATTQTGMGEMLKTQLEPILSKSWTMKIDEQGRLVELETGQQDNLPSMGDMGSISIPMPDKAVGVGDTWSAKREMDDMGTMLMNMTVEKITVEDVLIATQGDMVDASGKVLGTYSGHYTLDRHLGLTKNGVIQANMETAGQNIKMTVNFKSL